MKCVDPLDAEQKAKAKDAGYDLSRQLRSKVMFYGDVSTMLSLRTKMKVETIKAKALGATVSKTAAE